MKRSTPLTACRSCGSGELAPVLSLGYQPPANSLRVFREQQLPTFPLALCRCASCALIQLTETVDPAHLFDTYLWVTGTSPTSLEYSRTFCQQVRQRVGHGWPLSVVEVGSNDGTFLRRFQECGDKVLGIDPARNVAVQATTNGIPTWPMFFARGAARHVLDFEGPADVVYARNVLPHVNDPVDVLKGMADCLKDDGVAVVEFHSAAVILEELHYDSIYHEHLSYFSLWTFKNLLERVGLYPFDVGTSPISGGSLVVYCGKSERARSPSLAAMLTKEVRAGTDSPVRWNNFAVGAKSHSASLRYLMQEQLATGRTFIAYGASARGATLLNFAGLGEQQLLAMADCSPMKHGRWTPGSNLKVMPPDEALALKPDGVLLLAWNFADEILGELRQRNWHGRVIIPLPGQPTVVEV